VKSESKKLDLEKSESNKSESKSNRNSVKGTKKKLESDIIEFNPEKKKRTFDSGNYEEEIDPKNKITEDIYFESKSYKCPLLNDRNELSLVNRLFSFEFNKKRCWAIKRPYLDSFLDFLFENFDRVVLWSAGNYDYVHAVSNVIFNKHKPYKIYTRDDCESKNGSKSHKPLSKIAGTDKKLKNIFLVDNLPENSSSNEQNHFYIPDYDPEHPKITKSNLEYIDTALFKIQDFMKNNLFNKKASDVKDVIPMSRTLYRSSSHLFDSI
jgi:hypothetical protein